MDNEIKKLAYQRYEAHRLEILKGGYNQPIRNEDFYVDGFIDAIAALSFDRELLVAAIMEKNPPLDYSSHRLFLKAGKLGSTEKIKYARRFRRTCSNLV